MFKLTGTFTFLSLKRGISKSEQPFLCVWLLCDDGSPIQVFLSKSLDVDSCFSKFSVFSSGDIVSVSFNGVSYSSGLRLSVCDIEYI